MSWTRREALLGLGSIPILGAVWWAGARGTVGKKREREAILERLNIQPSLPSAVPVIPGAPVRVGIIGFGIRGEQLCRSLGYATDEWITAMEEAEALAKEEGRPFTALTDFRAQEPLNVRIVGVCDVFDTQAQKLIWEGVGKGEIETNPQKRERTIPQKVAKIMSYYPVQPVK